MLRNPFRDLDQKQLSRSSDILKSQNDYFKIVNKRIFIFSLIIVILFSCIILYKDLDIANISIFIFE